MLRIIPELGRVARLTLARIDRQVAGEDLEQGRLARAVRADKHNAITTLDGKIEVLVNPLFAVSLTHLAELDDLLVRARWLREGELERLARRTRFLVALKLFQKLDARLDLRGLGSNLTETIDEFLVLLDLFLLIAIRLHLLLVALLALIEIGRVIAGVGNELGCVGVDFDHRLNDRIHEIAIVRNHQNRARVIQQISLQPQQRQKVEVVGRLVEHQQVGLHHQQARKVRTHHPSTRILTRGLVEIILLEAQTIKTLLRLRLELVAIEVVELILRLGKIRMREIPLRFVLADRAQNSDHFRGDAHGDFDDRFIRRLARLLRQVPGDGVLVALDGPLVGRVLIKDHAEKRRLTRPVGTHEGHAFTPVNGHLGLAQERTPAEGFGELFNRQHARDVVQPRPAGKQFNGRVICF